LYQFIFSFVPTRTAKTPVAPKKENQNNSRSGQSPFFDLTCRILALLVLAGYYSKDILKAADVAQGAKTNDTTRKAASR
jgi:hypothetical protein